MSASILIKLLFVCLSHFFLTITYFCVMITLKFYHQGKTSTYTITYYCVVSWLPKTFLKLLTPKTRYNSKIKVSEQFIRKVLHGNLYAKLQCRANSDAGIGQTSNVWYTLGYGLDCTFNSIKVRDKRSLEYLQA